MLRKNSDYYADYTMDVIRKINQKKLAKSRVPSLLRNGTFSRVGIFPEKNDFGKISEKYGKKINWSRELVLEPGLL